MAAPLVQLPDGEVIPLGRTSRVLDEVFIPGTALPSWLTADIGTAAFNSGVAATTNPGQVTVATAASINSFARLTSSFLISGPNYKEIIWTVQGLVSDTDTMIDYYFGIAAAGNTGGVDLFQDPTMNTAILRTSAAGAQNGSYPTKERLVDGAEAGQGIAVARRYRNLTMRLQPTLGRVSIFEDDQDMEVIDVSATFVNSNSLRPQVMIKTREAVAHNFKLSRATLTLIH